MNSNYPDGCIYDTIPCTHTCEGCHYGIRECEKCGSLIMWPEEVCICEDEDEAA